VNLTSLYLKVLEGLELNDEIGCVGFGSFYMFMCVLCLQTEFLKDMAVLKF
jgi:hypothetical protein